VFILHSQGAIEGGMIIDWLLDEVPQDLLQYLEVYTFGNAANHFNNPYRDLQSSGVKDTGPKKKELQTKPLRHRAIAHIEHYANDRDFVSRWGVLNYTEKSSRDKLELENKFIGRVFKRSGSGHQFNQHYLDNIFPLDTNGQSVREPRPGDFMETIFEPGGNSENQAERESPRRSLYTTAQTEDQVTRYLQNAEYLFDGIATVNVIQRPQRMKDVSRLWGYRNGNVPLPKYDRNEN
jgi:hypothetical protein